MVIRKKATTKKAVKKPSPKRSAAAILGSLGGKARAMNMTKEELTAAMKKVAAARWHPVKKRLTKAEKNKVLDASTRQ